MFASPDMTFGVAGAEHERRSDHVRRPLRRRRARDRAGRRYRCTLMRILVVSTLYPPVAFGGYEVECSGVVERLRESATTCSS